MLFAAQKFTSVVVLRKRYILCTLRARACVCACMSVSATMAQSF